MLSTRALLAVAVTVFVALGPGGHRPLLPGDHVGGVSWESPTGTIRLVEAFLAPADRFSRGHRGVDLATGGLSALRAPAAGVVAFSGKVVDRIVVTIDHGGGYVSTLEPVEEPVPVGTSVKAGDPIGRVGTGGHSPPGSVHFGVRLDGEYVNPLRMIDGVPRAVLLPCC